MENITWSVMGKQTTQAEKVNWTYLGAKMFLITKACSSLISIKEAYALVGTVGHMHKHKHKNIKTLQLSYAYVAVMSRGDMVGISISISISKRLSANQRVLYTYADLVLTGHNSDISIGRKLMLTLHLFPLAHMHFMFMLVLMPVLQVRTWLN